MDLKGTPAIILLVVMIGLVVGVGVIILDEFATAVKTSTDVSNETVTVAAGAGTTTNDDVTAISEVINATNGQVYIRNNETSSNQWNDTLTGFVTSVDVSQVNVTYTYLADSSTSTVMDSSRNATDDFVTWLPIIVIVVATSIILGLVLTSFRA